MPDLVIYRFQPDAMEEEVLDKLLVARRDLLSKMQEEIENAVENKTPKYYLIVGSRGIGKSHFIALLYHRLKGLEGALRVKLSEEEYSIYRVSDFFSRVFEEIEGKKFSEGFENENELVEAILENIKSKNEMIIIFVENLNQIFEEQMDEKDVKQLRSIFQENDIFIVIATSPLKFSAITQGDEPFYHFFTVKHLREFNEEEVKEMIKILYELEGKPGDLKLYYGRIDSIVKLTGGSPRIVILLYDLMSKGDISGVEEAFFKILDEYTPYYQDLFKLLTGQKRRIFDILISFEGPAIPKEIAEAARLDNNTVVTQLRRLEKDGYVISRRDGRNVKYEVRERLFRLWRELRQPFGRKRVKIFIEFLKLWYTLEEREKEFLDIISQLKTVDSGLIRRAEYFFWTLPEESKMKFMPEITREFYESGMPKLLEEFVETEDEKLRRAFESEKLKILNEEIEKIIYLFKEEKYDDCMEKIEEIIKKNGENETILLLKGFTLVFLQKYEEALQTFDRAIEINPENFLVWKIKGFTLVFLQRYEEALQAFDRAIEINPEDADVWYNKGFALASLQRHEEALQVFDRAIEINPRNTDVWVGKGFALASLQRHEEALQVFDRAIEINPEDAVVWYNKGIALVSLQRYEEALQAFDRAIEIDSEDASAWFDKGFTLSSLQRFEEALQAFDRAIEIDSEDASAWSNKGGALTSLQRFEEALQAFDRAIEIDSRNASAWSNKGIALASLQRHEEALQAFDRAIEIDSEGVSAWYGKGQALKFLERHEEALQAFDRAIEINPEDVSAWYNKGIALASLQRHEEALQAFDRAIEIDSEDVSAWYNKGIALVSLQRYEEAFQAFDRAIEINPWNANAWVGKGATLIFLQRYEEAFQAFDRAIEIDSEDVSAWSNKGIALASLQRYEEALQAFDRAIEIDSEDVSAWSNAATVHLKIVTQELKKDNYGNAVENLNSAMDFFLKIWNVEEEEIKEKILAFLKDLTDSKKIEAVDISLKTILKKKEDLALFLKPISAALEIVKTKNLRKYYDLQMEERDIVADIVKRLTGSEELLPEEYRKSRNIHS